MPSFLRLHPLAGVAAASTVRRTIRTICVTALAALVPRPAAGQDTALDSALARLEAADSLDAAALLFRSPRAALNSTQRSHARALDSLRLALQASRAYAEASQFEAALELLTGVRLDPLHLHRLNARRLREIELVRAARQRHLDARATEGMRKARAMESANRFADAQAVLAELRKETGFSQEIRDKLGDRLREVERTAASRSNLFTQRMTTQLVTTLGSVLSLVGQLTIFAVFALLFFLYRRWCPSRGGTALAIVDLTAPESDRERQSRLLAREIRKQIRDLNEPRVRVHGARQKDFDGFPYLQPDFSVLAQVKSMISDEAVKVGSISLRPAELISFVAALFARPHEFVLNGYLYTDAGGVTTLYVERLARGRAREAVLVRRLWRRLIHKERAREGDTARAGSDWKAVATGEAAREDVVREFALHYVFDMTGRSADTNWPSFQAYESGMKHLSREDDRERRNEALERACDAFELSVRKDADHWMARFRLAETLRKLNRPDPALRHFAALDRLVKAPEKHPHTLREYLKHSPEFALLIEYNRGVTLSMLLTVEAQQRAVDLFDHLRAVLADPARTAECRLTGAACERLRVLVLSARASAIVSMQDAMLEREGRSTRGTQAFAALTKEVQQILDELKSITPPEEAETRASHELALAAAENAAGRSLHLQRRYRKALDHFQDALTRMPDMVDPYVGVAAAYLKLKAKASPQWRELAEDALDKALELNSSNGKARYYYGLLEIERGNYEEAKHHFNLSDAHPWTLFQHAQLIAEQDRDYAGAVKLLRRSIRLLPRPDYRYILFVKLVLRMRGVGQETDELAAEAGHFAKAIQTHGDDKSLRTQGASLLAKLQGTAPVAEDELAMA